MKRTLTLSVLLILMMMTSLVSAQYPDPPRGLQFVNDYADMLSPTTERKVQEICKTYNRTTTIEMVVVTIKTLQGIDPNSYATTLANRWGVGKSTLHNGVFLLIAQKERKFVLKPGKGLEQYYNKSMSNAVVVGNNSVMVPYFKRGDFDGGVLAAIKKIQSQLGNATWNMREAHYAELERKKRVATAERERKALEAEKITVQQSLITLKKTVRDIADYEEHEFISLSTKEEIKTFLGKIDSYIVTQYLAENKQSYNSLQSRYRFLMMIIKSEITTGEKVAAEESRKEKMRIVFVSLLGLFICTLLVYLFVRSYRRKKLTERLNKVFDTDIVGLLNRLDDFFQKQYILPKKYPTWALTELEDHLASGKKLSISLYDPVNKLGALIDRDPFAAESNMTIEGLDILQSHYDKITVEIPQLVRKYRDDAPEKVLEASTKYDKNSAFLQTIEKRGFDFSSQEKALQEIHDRIDILKDSISSESVIYRDVYLTAEKCSIEIDEIKSDIDQVIGAHYYVIEKSPDVQKYLGTIQEEFSETQDVWLQMNEAYPTSAYSDLHDDLSSVDEKFTQVQQLIARAIQDNSFTDQQFLEAKTKLDGANNTLQWIDRFLDTIRERNADLIAAEKTFRELYPLTQNLVTKMSRKIKDSDVNSYTECKGEQLSLLFAQVDTSMDTADWIAVLSELKRIKSQVQGVYNDAKNEIASAESARRAEARRAAARRAAARKKRNDSYSSSSSSSFSSSSFSSSGSSSSFGGGGFSSGSGSVGGW